MGLTSGRQRVEVVLLGRTLRRDRWAAREPIMRYGDRIGKLATVFSQQAYPKQKITAHTRPFIF